VDTRCPAHSRLRKPVSVRFDGFETAAHHKHKPLGRRPALFPPGLSKDLRGRGWPGVLDVGRLPGGSFALATVATVSANTYDFMGEDELLSQLSTELSSAQRSEARGDGDAAVAKTAAIKNIQKALTARILKRLDDGQPLVEVARKMKAIEGMQP